MGHTVCSHSGNAFGEYHTPHGFLYRIYKWQRHQMKRFSALLARCEGNSPVTGEFRAQRASNAENVYIWWRHHEMVDMISDH